MDANVRFDHQLLAVESEHAVHCMLELDVPAAAVKERAPLHLALVIDRSGSMAGRSLDVAKDCAEFLARHLQSNDELAVVTYDDTVDLVLPLAPAKPVAAHAAIAAIAPGGSTNLSGGWLKGLEELRRADDGVRRVLLLTDGLANVGVTDKAQLVSIATGTKEQASTTTIGFGAGFDEDLLNAIADASGGASYFAETPDDAPGIFAEEFEGLATLVAQNVSVEIRPGADVELLAVLNEYPSIAVPGGVQVQVGDAYGGERRRLVFRLQIPDVAKLGPARVADVILRYVNVGEQVATHETTIPVIVNLVSADEAAAATLDQEVVDEVVLLHAANARKEAARQADAGRFDIARAMLRDSADEIRRIAPHSARSAELMDEVAMLETHTFAMSEETYEPLTRKRMIDESRRRNRGRKP
ncbi:MAG: VWA domain-containing protein [Actinomycetota bacterium]|nr:VWA domain-containing protein [Actinomycetota bacterium]